MNRNNRGELDAYAWPGGYPLYYVTSDDGVLCPKCANKEGHEGGDSDGFKLEGVDANYEDDALYCNNCNAHIESAYGE